MNVIDLVVLQIGADNYDSLATSDNGSCSLLACTESWADNYDELATLDDNSCYRNGCMDSTMFNYDELLQLIMEHVISCIWLYVRMGR